MGNRITYIGTRNTRVLAVASVDIDGPNNQTYLIELRKNGNAVDGLRSKVRKVTAVAAGSIVGHIPLEENDFVELWITNTTSSDNPVVSDATFALMKLTWQGCFRQGHGTSRTATGSPPQRWRSLTHATSIRQGEIPPLPRRTNDRHSMCGLWRHIHQRARLSGPLTQLCDEAVGGEPSHQPEAVMIIDWPIWVSFPMVIGGFVAAVAVTIRQEKEHTQCVTRTRTRKRSARSVRGSSL
jgi:hypothetical protein